MVVMMHKEEALFNCTGTLKETGKFSATNPELWLLQELIQRLANFKPFSFSPSKLVLSYWINSHCILYTHLILLAGSHSLNPLVSGSPSSLKSTMLYKIQMSEPQSTSKISKYLERGFNNQCLKIFLIMILMCNHHWKSFKDYTHVNIQPYFYLF